MRRQEGLEQTLRNANHEVMGSTEVPRRFSEGWPQRSKENQDGFHGRGNQGARVTWVNCRPLGLREGTPIGLSLKGLPPEPQLRP